jgi:hypothetical protein
MVCLNKEGKAEEALERTRKVETAVEGKAGNFKKG